MLVGLVAIGATEFYVVGIALPRTSVTSEHIYIMSTFFAQSEVMALCLGLGSAVILSGLMVMVPKN